MKAIKKNLAEVESEIERLQSNLQIAYAMVYAGIEQLQKLLCSTRKILKGRANLHNRILLRDLRGKENVMMIWRGVEKKKQVIAKKIVLHLPITDPTHLLEVSVF